MSPPTGPDGRAWQRSPLGRTTPGKQSKQNKRKSMQHKSGPRAVGEEKKKQTVPGPSGSKTSGGSDHPVVRVRQIGRAKVLEEIKRTPPDPGQLNLPGGAVGGGTLKKAAPIYHRLGPLEEVTLIEETTVYRHWAKLGRISELMFVLNP